MAARDYSSLLRADERPGATRTCKRGSQHTPNCARSVGGLLPHQHVRSRKCGLSHVLGEDVRREPTRLVERQRRHGAGAMDADHEVVRLQDGGGQTIIEAAVGGTTTLGTRVRELKLPALNTSSDEEYATWLWQTEYKLLRAPPSQGVVQ